MKDLRWLRKPLVVGFSVAGAVGCLIVGGESGEYLAGWFCALAVLYATFAE